MPRRPIRRLGTRLVAYSSAPTTGQRTNSLHSFPPFPSPPLPYPAFSFRILSPRLPLEVDLLNTARGSGGALLVPQCGLEQSRSRQMIWCILEWKSAALVAAVFVDFPENKCNFFYKYLLGVRSKTEKKLYLGPIPHRAARYEEFFSWGSRHELPYGSRRLCLMEVWSRCWTWTRPT